MSKTIKIYFKEKERRSCPINIPLDFIRYLGWKNEDEIELSLIPNNEGFGEGIILKKKDGKPPNVIFELWDLMMNDVEKRIKQKQRRYYRTSKGKAYFNRIKEKSKKKEPFKTKEAQEAWKLLMKYGIRKKRKKYKP